MMPTALGNTRTIQRMSQAVYQQQQVAEAIGKSASSIGRELARNCDGRNGAYTAALAGRKSAQRRKKKPRAVRFTAPRRAYVDQLLRRK